MEKNFFCIRGYMKSGTNWLGRILKASPAVDCVGEFHWESFYQALETNTNRIAPKRADHYGNTVRSNLESAIKQSLIDFADPEAKWIGDRTPTTLAPLAIHDAPHIVIVRDFRDVIVSRMFHLYNHPRITTVFDQYPAMKSRLEKFQDDAWYFKKNPQELLDNEEIIRTSAKEWAEFQVRDNQTIQENSDLKVLRIRYEDLHSDFVTQANSLFDFIGIDPPELYPERLTAGHNVESPKELNRKGIVGDWRNYASDSCLGWIMEEAASQMRELGYG